MPNFFLLKKRKKEYDLEEERRLFQESLRASAEVTKGHSQSQGQACQEIYRPHSVGKKDISWHNFVQILRS